ncbi:MAG: hypothetical protein E7474_04790 [Ruminococcaceae bacterium]|nr:hypothetical protein [Oscillospiraceae bacterium]
MIELTGTLKERLDQAIRLTRVEVSEEKLAHFRAVYRRAGIALLPSAEEFYRQYGGVFRKQYLFLDEPRYNRDVYLDFYADSSDSEGDVLRRLDEAMIDMEQVRDFAKQDTCPVGDIGFYYPACVYVGADGLLYCVFEYKDEIEIHREPSEILEEQLRNHLPVGIDDYPIKTRRVYRIETERFSLELEADAHPGKYYRPMDPSLRVRALSGGSAGEAYLDVDKPALGAFAARLNELYETQCGSARLEDSGGAPHFVTFAAGTGSRIRVCGKLRGDAAAFESELDRTELKDFAKALFSCFGGSAECV